MRCDVTAVSLSNWSRDKCFSSDFDKATFGRATHANSNGGSVSVSATK